MKKLIQRIKSAYAVFKMDHFIVYHIDRENLMNLYKGNLFECDYMIRGLNNHAANTINRAVFEHKNDIDIFLDRMAFEAEFETHENKS